MRQRGLVAGTVVPGLRVRDRRKLQDDDAVGRAALDCLERAVHRERRNLEIAFVLAAQPLVFVIFRGFAERRFAQENHVGRHGLVYSSSVIKSRAASTPHVALPPFLLEYRRTTLLINFLL